MNAQKTITLADAHGLEATGHSVHILRGNTYLIDGIRVKVVARRATDRQAYAARALSIEMAQLREQARAGTLYGRVIA